MFGGLRGYFQRQGILPNVRVGNDGVCLYCWVDGDFDGVGSSGAASSGASRGSRVGGL